jgi:hypothetical protein
METRLRDQNLFGWDRQSEPGDTHWIYLPLIQSPEKINQRINAPFFAGDILFSETGIFWFGLVNPSDNYADVRVGYNPSELFVNITRTKIFSIDRPAQWWGRERKLAGWISRQWYNLAKGAAGFFHSKWLARQFSQ